MVLELAAIVAVLIGAPLAAPILNPILSALALALIRGPVYAGLLRRGLPTLLALPIMLVGLGALSLALFVFRSLSITRFRTDLAI